MQLDLSERISKRTARVVVIGLGYVGLPVATLVAEAGYMVTGLDVRADRVRSISAGLNPIGGAEPGLSELLTQMVTAGRLKASTDYAECREADIVLIAVETPVDPISNRPSYDALRAVLHGLAAHCPAHALVIVESTIAPGTMERVVEPALRAAGAELHLVHCPERLTPGRLLRNIREMPRVVGGMTANARDLAVAFYEHFVHAPLEGVDALTAETVKTAENAYRDVQIAFANELALICEDLGTDVWQVRELINKVPGRQVHMPGPGVGGHCIPKDPWLLLTHVSEGTRARLLPTARAVNDGMPHHVAALITRTLAESDRDIVGAEIAILGYAYKEDSDDTRNTPSAALVQRLEELGAHVRVQDPCVPHLDLPLATALKGADCAVLMVAHEAYRLAPWSEIVRALRIPILVDCRNILPNALEGVRYVRLGDGQTARRNGPPADLRLDG